jgi:hypothetical protein
MKIFAGVVRGSEATLPGGMAKGRKDSSRPIMAGGNRASARDLQDHAKVRKELPQRRFSTRGTAGQDSVK